MTISHWSKSISTATTTNKRHVMHLFCIFYISIQISSIQGMTLCEYYNALGEYRPECHQTDSDQLNTFEHNNNIDPEPFYESVNNNQMQVFQANSWSQPPPQRGSRFVFSKLSPSNPFVSSSESSEAAGKSYPAHQLCTGFFHTCFASTQCESGTICTNMFSTKQCCTAVNSECPNPTQLGYNCRKINPTNWCYNNNDCHSSKSMNKMVCCPSGCNYNVCIAPHHHQQYIPQPALQMSTLYRATKMLSEDCPDPLSIPMRCHKFNPTDWCHSHNDCPSAHNALNPRRCCFTPCGYRACFIKFGGTWMIG